jgi:hypothetical protein
MSFVDVPLEVFILNVAPLLSARETREILFGVYLRSYLKPDKSLRFEKDISSLIRPYIEPVHITTQPFLFVCDREKVLWKLVDLNPWVDQKKMFRVLHLLQQKGVIAGGSMVYALNDFVPKESVSDIDVFMTYDEKGEFHKQEETVCRSVLNALLEEFPDAVVKTPYGATTGVSVVTVFLMPSMLTEEEVSLPHFSNVPIQLIFNHLQHPQDIIESFDLDYVQCALSNNRIYITSEAREAHQRRRVRYVWFKTGKNVDLAKSQFDHEALSLLSVTIHRLRKAMNKGFQSYDFAGPTYIPTAYVTIDPSRLRFRSMNNRFYSMFLGQKTEDWLDLDSLSLNRIERQEKGGSLFYLSCWTKAHTRKIITSQCCVLRLNVVMHEASFVTAKYVPSEKPCREYPTFPDKDWFLENKKYKRDYYPPPQAFSTEGYCTFRTFWKDYIPYKTRKEKHLQQTECPKKFPKGENNYMIVEPCYYENTCHLSDLSHPLALPVPWYKDTSKNEDDWNRKQKLTAWLKS